MLEKSVDEQKTHGQEADEQVAEEPSNTVNASVRPAIIEKCEDFTLASVERQLILECLKQCEGNRTQAAKMMGVSIRTVRNKLIQYKDEACAEFSAYY